MLDVYLIKDEIETPESPDKLIYIGGIDLDEHKILENVFLLLKRKEFIFHIPMTGRAT